MKKRELRRILKKKRFVEVLAGKDHIYLYLRDPNDPEKYCSHIRTKVSHSGKEKDISDNLMSKIYKQLRFRSKRELEEYLDCTITYEEYTRYLKSIDAI